MIILPTPDAPHPKIDLITVNYRDGVIRWNWLNDDESLADSGNSLVNFTPAGATISDAEIVALITATAT